MQKLATPRRLAGRVLGPAASLDFGNCPNEATLLAAPRKIVPPFPPPAWASFLTSHHAPAGTAPSPNRPTVQAKCHQAKYRCISRPKPHCRKIARIVRPPPGPFRCIASPKSPPLGPAPVTPLSRGTWLSNSAPPPPNSGWAFPYEIRPAGQKNRSPCPSVSISASQKCPPPNIPP